MPREEQVGKDLIEENNQRLRVRANFYLIKCAWAYKTKNEIKRNTFTLGKWLNLSKENIPNEIRTIYSSLINGSRSASMKFIANLPHRIKSADEFNNFCTQTGISDNIITGNELLNIGEKYNLDFWKNFFGLMDEKDKIYGTNKENGAKKEFTERFKEIEESEADDYAVIKNLLSAMHKYETREPLPRYAERIFEAAELADEEYLLKRILEDERVFNHKDWGDYIKILETHLESVKKCVRYVEGYREIENLKKKKQQ